MTDTETPLKIAKRGSDYWHDRARAIAVSYSTRPYNSRPNQIVKMAEDMCDEERARIVASIRRRATEWLRCPGEDHKPDESQHAHVLADWIERGCPDE